MNLFRVLAIGVVAFTVNDGVRGQGRVDPQMLIGVWEVTKGDPNIANNGSTFEFTKDGGLAFVMKLQGKERKFDMTYKLEGAKLTTQLKGAGPRIVTIKKLSDRQLIWEESSRKQIELTRKK